MYIGISFYECRKKGVKLIPFLIQNKKYFLIGSVILAAILFYFFNQSSTEPTTPLEPIEQLSSTSNEPSSTKVPEPINQTSIQTTIAVDVKGAVKNPGVYTVNAKDRVYDAIIAAGGYKNNADSKTINHAAHVQDEMVIYVPKRGEEIETTVAATTQSTETQSSTTTVNINTADEAGLQTISGIGPAKAKTIIQYRTENGPFQSVDDLKNISGFGEKTVERLRPLVTVQ